MAVYNSRFDVKGRSLVAVYISSLMLWVGGIVAVQISKLDCMGKSRCGCLHF